VLARDAGEGYTTLGVARIREAPGRQPVVLDDGYIAPMLHAPGHPILDGYLRELLGLLHQRGEALASSCWRSLAAPVSARSPTSCCCRPSTATSRVRPCCGGWSVLHPERLYTVPAAGRRPGHLP
jgi:type VI secretion system protein ImpJ